MLWISVRSQTARDLKWKKRRSRLNRPTFAPSSLFHHNTIGTRVTQCESSVSGRKCVPRHVPPHIYLSNSFHRSHHLLVRLYKCIPNGREETLNWKHKSLTARRMRLKEEEDGVQRETLWRIKSEQRWWSKSRRDPPNTGWWVAWDGEWEKKENRIMIMTGRCTEFSNQKRFFIQSIILCCWAFWVSSSWCIQSFFSRLLFHSSFIFSALTRHTQHTVFYKQFIC